MTQPEQPEQPQFVSMEVVRGTQLHPLPGRGWLTFPVLVLGHLPLSLLNRLTGGRLNSVAVALHRWEVRVAFGRDLPRAHHGR